MNAIADIPGAETPTLPLWLEEVLPEPTEPHRLSTLVEDGVRILRLTSPAGEVADFCSVREVDESKRVNSLDLSIEKEVYEIFGDGLRRFGLRYEVDNPNHVGMLLAYSDAKRRGSLERAYADSLEAQQLYAWDPQDFARSWRFIDSHPAFWTAQDLDSHPWYWETEGYCSKLRQYVSANEAGGYLVQLEAGGHVEYAASPGSTAYREHYSDWRLEVRRESFEAAIIELAFRVFHSFDSEGNSRDEDSFPYELPGWMKDLREQISEED